MTLLDYDRCILDGVKLINQCDVPLDQAARYVMEVACPNGDFIKTRKDILNKMIDLGKFPELRTFQALILANENILDIMDAVKKANPNNGDWLEFSARLDHMTNDIIRTAADTAFKNFTGNIGFLMTMIGLQELVKKNEAIRAS